MSTCVTEIDEEIGKTIDDEKPEIEMVSNLYTLRSHALLSL